MTAGRARASRKVTAGRAREPAEERAASRGRWRRPAEVGVPVAASRERERGVPESFPAESGEEGELGTPQFFRVRWFWIWREYSLIGATLF